MDFQTEELLPELDPEPEEHWRRRNPLQPVGDASGAHRSHPSDSAKNGRQDDHNRVGLLLQRVLFGKSWQTGK